MKIEHGDRMEYHVNFYGEGEATNPLFKGEFLESCFVVDSIDGVTTLMVGMGSEFEERNQIKEIYATAVKEMIKHGIEGFSCDIVKVMERYGEEALRDIVEGLILGEYEPEHFPTKEKFECTVSLTGGLWNKEQGQVVQEMIYVLQGVIFARDMVNKPANMLRPSDFVQEISEFMEGLPVEIAVFSKKELEEMGLGGLMTVGGSSMFPPYLLVMRYLPNKGGSITGLVGKGVTCDTGGYCIKSAGSMEGIKGDMAGGAAVAGAVFALAQNEVTENVVAVIPICENRIASDAYIPGDVITSYSGRTIEVLNTDAEGRLILADAISFAIQNEQVERVVDIATLTGAVAVALGGQVAGTLSQNEEFYQEFEKAFKISGERYHRLPWYREHEKMIKSSIADVKNVGGNHSGSITAGLFLKQFVEGRPWIHLDIAGTASVDPPLFAYQSKGATGAGVTSLYYLCKNTSQYTSTALHK